MDKRISTLLYNTANKLARRLDDIRGLDFLSTAQPDELGLDGTLVHRSSPSGDRYLRGVLRALRITSVDRIIDIGCGKGSAMREMLRFPFAAVDGLEISQSLGQIAARNMVRIGSRRSSIFIQNAVDFGGYGNFGFFYLYNPFPDSVMAAVVPRIVEQVGKAGEMIIIYNNPICGDILRQHGLEAIVRFPDLWGNGIVVFANNEGMQRLSYLR